MRWHCIRFRSSDVIREALLIIILVYKDPFITRSSFSFTAKLQKARKAVDF